MPQFRGACVAGHVPSSSASFSSSFSPCLLRRPFSSFCLLPLLGCVRWFTTSLPGVVSQCRGACVAGHVPSSSSSSFFFLLLFRPVFFFVLSSFCLPPLLGVRVLVYHVLTWGGVPVSGCVCCWPRPFLFCFFCFFFFLFFFVLSLSVSLLFLGCVCWLTTFLITWGCVPVSGCVLLEATLGFGRCLWGLSPGVQCFLTTTFDNWARQLLVAKPWNNAASCQADLDWTFDASDRIAIDIASVRPKLWTLEGAIAGRLFRSSHVSNVPSWASISRQFLASKDILDWPTWVSRRAAETGSYKQYVKHTLKKAASTHLKDSLGLNLPWNVLLSQRSCHSSPTGLRCIWARKRQEVQSQPGSRNASYVRRGILM